MTQMGHKQASPPPSPLLSLLMIAQDCLCGEDYGRENTGAEGGDG